ncbi:MAG: BolA/IbaG family iron-sulfur metabolism protein [Pseudomonadales bacterium]|nr:BolA/IbaG family iron-sulfur metabolism protein [Pseudomonadales bacterium]
MSIQTTSVEEKIFTKLSAAFRPVHLVVENESHMHAVPENSETHFKVVLVAERFEGMRQVARHQLVYRELTEELAGPVHALALHTFTGTEWTHRQAVPQSPDCKGGSANEKRNADRQS